jgi:hypothetical protein
MAQDRYIETDLMPTVRKNLKDPNNKNRVHDLFRKIYNISRSY